MDYFAIGEDKSLKNVNDVGSWEKLWENPNPASDFPAQTISLSKNLSYGDEIAIITYMGAVFFGKLTHTTGNSLLLSNMGMYYLPSGYLYIHTRRADFSGGNSTMTFTDCNKNGFMKNGDNWPQTPIRDYVESNGELVPIAVYKRLSNVFN